MNSALIAKKLFFSLPFFFFYILFSVNFLPFLSKPSLMFSFDIDIYIQFFILFGLLLGSCISFVIFATLADDIRIILPVAAITSYTSILFIGTTDALLMTGGSLLSFAIVYLALHRRLKTYLTFSAGSLLIPSIRETSTLLLLSASLLLFVSAKKDIDINGFQIPESLLNTSLQLTLPQGQTLSQDANSSRFPQISGEQIEQLKENPELLTQFGITQEDLNTLTNQNGSQPSKFIESRDIVKQAVENQVQGIIKPYIQFIPILITLSFFLIGKSILSIFSLLLNPILWLLFNVLEKSHFISFTTESRPIRKLVVL